jgi:hypothetical protein
MEGFIILAYLHSFIVLKRYLPVFIEGRLIEAALKTQKT